MRALGLVLVSWFAFACGQVETPILDAGTDGTVVDGYSIDTPAPPDCNNRPCNSTAADNCCPAGCNANVDLDCAPRCGNSVIEGNETCDPLLSCPTACPQQGCTLRTLANPGTCAAVCVDAGTQSQCVLGADGCCPAGCTAANDTDCAAVCGNGTIEAGETCDPLASCPTSCPQQGCQLFSLVQGGTCRADCVPAGQQAACVNDDGCCPGGCNANNDSDCTPACGNNVVEGNETCDPLGSCPASCPALGCQLRTLTNAGTCTAECVNGGQQTACVNDDQCCPAGCTTVDDNDCLPGCGNNVVEPPETCDPVASCPTECPPIGCELRTLQAPGTCTAACVTAGSQTACENGDGCCPAGCSAANDSDCTAVCGNNVIEPGETCDPPGSCACPGEPYSCFTTSGSAATCDLRCHVPVQACTAGDACCPYVAGGGGECSSVTDDECNGTGGWRFTQIGVAAYDTAQCTTISVYGLELGGSYVFTTCTPPGFTAGTGDPVIASVIDNNGQSYNVTNDDCGDPAALPQLAGWGCLNDGGIVRMSCASPSPGGFRLENPNVFRLDVKICPFNGTAFGSAPFHVWWNGDGFPNSG